MSDEPGALTTGWEPGVPAGDTLARRFLLGEVERVRLVADRFARTDELVLADRPGGLVFDTAAVLLQPPPAVDLAGVVEAADAFFPPEKTWCLFSMWPTPDLRHLGLELVGHPPLMYRPAGPIAGPDRTRRPLPDGFRVAEVSTEAELAEYSRVVVEGYPVDGGGTVGPASVLGTDYRFWLGRQGDEAVAGAAAHVCHGLNEVTWVATLPHARGRGYGRAVTEAATCAEPSLAAVLVASDDGRPLYEGLGFVSVLRITLWWRRGQGRST